MRYSFQRNNSNLKIMWYTNFANKTYLIETSHGTYMHLFRIENLFGILEVTSIQITRAGLCSFKCALINYHLWSLRNRLFTCWWKDTQIICTIFSHPLMFFGHTLFMSCLSVYNDVLFIKFDQIENKCVFQKYVV